MSPHAPALLLSAICLPLRSRTLHWCHESCGKNHATFAYAQLSLSCDELILLQWLSPV
jgi:hypothetical protein